RAPRRVPPLSSEHLALPVAYTTQMGGYEHLLTRAKSIRTANPDRYEPHRAIALALAVGETGDVLAASPVAGPTQFYAAAVEIVSKWKFVPFVRDGKPAAVRLERVAIKIEGPELWLPFPVPFPSVSDLDSVLIRLKRYGYEEGFSIEIRGDGSITFVG